MHSNGLLTRKAQSDSLMEYTNICSENELPDVYNLKPNLIEPSKPRGLPNLNTSSSGLSCEDKVFMKDEVLQQGFLNINDASSSIIQDQNGQTSDPNSSKQPVESSINVTKPRLLTQFSTHRSCEEKTLVNESNNVGGLSSRSRGNKFSDILDIQHNGLMPSPSFNRSIASTPRSGATFLHPMLFDAWEALKRSLVYFRGMPVGTIAALDPTEDSLNYNQVFVRDFFPSALAFLMNGEPEIVKNFLIKTLRLQALTKRIDNFTLGDGAMPASFKVLHDVNRKTDTMVADFGDSAIGRVAPVDSGFWWIILLRAYTKSTGNHALADMPDFQRGMRLILSLCLSEGFDTFPTLLCADGCCMVDRRMGIYGYPVEIQTLFFLALRCARVLLKPEAGGKEFIERIDKRLHALSFHMREYYWLDFEQLNNIYRYKTEEYSHTAVNKFNVNPDSIPDWVFDFMPTEGGYFIGNVSPACMDFRWFCLGNCVAILSSLATPTQEAAIMDLFEERWQDLVGEMPLKVAYPALENHEWRIVTGCDPKNTRWSYHNGGSWPVLLWLFTAACIKTGRPQMARRAIEIAEQRLSNDHWPEYYDGKQGRFIGKQARKMQTWSIAGYLVAKMMLEDPSHLGMIALEEDKKMKPTLVRSTSF